MALLETYASKSNKAELAAVTVWSIIEGRTRIIIVVQYHRLFTAG
jgi:hypothetical protein